MRGAHVSESGGGSSSGGLVRLALWLCYAFVAYNVYRWHSPPGLVVARERRVLPVPLAKQPTTWDVEWAFIVHVSADPARLAAIRKTWARRHDARLAFVFWGEEVRKVDDDLFVATGGRNAFEATQAALAAALRAFPFARTLCKFDDDTYVYSRELLRRVEGVEYGGYPMQAAGFTYASGGAGYVLSRAAAQRVLQCAPSDARYEDWAVGECMHRAGVPLVDLVGLHPHHPFQMLRWNKHNTHPADRVRRQEPVEGFMNPLSYHYVSPDDMVRMHDDIHTFGASNTTTGHGDHRYLHQFWEGDDGSRPAMFMQKCRDVQAGWTQLIWNRRLIRARFPSPASSSAVSVLTYDNNLNRGELVNQDFFDRAVELNLLSDILRYEVLMLLGGMYVDADSECFRPIDFLLRDHTRATQGVGFLEKDVHYLNGLLASGVIFAHHAYSPLAVVLVSELRHTDWSLAPWQSAGPMYFTKIVQLFKARIARGDVPAYLDVTVLPSQHVYPYHYSDARPDDAHLQAAVLAEKGAVMDQKWGTTKGGYRHGAEWLKDPPPLLAHDGGDGRLQRYARDVHARGLSAATVHRPRWVVAALHPDAGLCNRIMHVLSTLAFAMATGRVLLFDWDAEPPHMHENGIERVGQSRYEDLFRSPPPLRFSLREARARFAEPPQEDALRITRDNTRFLRDLRFADLDAQYPQSLIVIERFDWWAAPLFANPFYAHDVGNSSASAFAALFRFLFSPRHEPAAHADCDWLVHHRSRWERATAPIDAYVRCADPAARLLVIGDSSNETCRDGLECDRAAVSTLYAAAKCSRAVLTHTSTFGACIAGLWEMGETYVVHADGSCARRRFVDPIDAGALSQADAQVTAALDAAPEPSVKRAAVRYLVDPTDADVVALQRQLLRLHDDDVTPLVLVVRDPAQWAHVQASTRARVHVVTEAEAPALLARFDEVTAP